MRAGRTQSVQDIISSNTLNIFYLGFILERDVLSWLSPLFLFSPHPLLSPICRWMRVMGPTNYDRFWLLDHWTVLAQNTNDKELRISLIIICLLWLYYFPINCIINFTFCCVPFKVLFRYRFGKQLLTINCLSLLWYWRHAKLSNNNKYAPNFRVCLLNQTAGNKYMEVLVSRILTTKICKDLPVAFSSQNFTKYFH